MIELEDKHRVGISIINEVHKTFIGILNKAITAEKHSKGPNYVLGILDEMTEYALKHIQTEENYMKEFNFPGYLPHRNEHIDFTSSSIDYKNRVVGGDFQIINEILEYLKQWLINHVQVTDKKYIDCFKKNGLK